MHVELLGVEAKGFIEVRPLVVIEVHGNVDGQAEETCPQLGAPGGQELRVALQHGSEEVAMAVLVLAPVLKLLEDGVALPSKRSTKTTKKVRRELHIQGKLDAIRREHQCT